MSTNSNTVFPIPAERVHEMISKWHELDTTLETLTDNFYCARCAVDALRAAIQLVVGLPILQEELSEDEKEGEGEEEEEGEGEEEEVRFTQEREYDVIYWSEICDDFIMIWEGIL
jgi:hypothetical protein